MHAGFGQDRKDATLTDLCMKTSGESERVKLDAHMADDELEVVVANECVDGKNKPAFRL